MRRWFGALMIAMLVPPAVHAAPSCIVPANLPVPHAETPGPRDAPRTVPIGGYTLSMFWMPQHCRRPIGGIKEVDCAAPDVRAHDLTLHGLWPDGSDTNASNGKGPDWPQWCQPAAILSPATIRAHYCATPSPQLLQHEWAKHGTCVPGATPDRFFDQADRLFAGVRTPDLRALSYGHATVDSVRAAFAAANPGLAAGMLTLALDRDGWLEEVRLCLDTRYRPRACPATGRGPRGDDPVLIWRGGRGGGGAARSGYARRDGYR